MFSPKRNFAKSVAALISAVMLFCGQSVYAEPIDNTVSPEQIETEADNKGTALTEPMSDYVLGPGDVLNVIDGNDSNFSGQAVPVLQNGTVSFYPVGEIDAQGKTIKEISDTINERAQSLVANPNYQVNLAQGRPVNLYVLGEVKYPGKYNLPASTDNLLPNVLTAIETAGGLRPEANVRRIEIRRGGEKINVDLWKIAADGESKQAIRLRPNDVVFANRGGNEFNPDGLGNLAAEKGHWVRVLGSVRAPGLIELRPSDNLYSVIARAGGFGAGAASRSVVLSRMNRDGSVWSKRISLARGLKDREALAALPVQSGDIVLVSTSLIKTAGVEVARAGMITALAMLIIYFSNKVHNVNVVTNDSGTSTDTTTTTTTTTTP